MNNLQTLTLDSREVAKMLNKRHSDLLRDIETYIGYLGQNADLRSDDFFKEESYKSGTGRSYKTYQISKNGCEFLAHKQTGRKGAIFTASYIQRFHEMEAELKLRNEMKQKALSPSQSLEYVCPLQNVEYMGVLGEVKSYITAAGVLSENVTQERLKSEHIAGVKFLSDVLSRAAWKCSKLADINMVVDVR